MKTLKYIIAAVFVVTADAHAQLNPMGSSYFQNQYLVNPAMAGVRQGWETGGSYKAQWTAIDGSPSMQALTLAYGTPDHKVGFGLNLYNESAGVIRRIGLKATYAYHLPLNDHFSYIDFGLSGGFMDEWIDFSKVVAELDDHSLQQFNERKLYIDGDFGMIFRNQQLTVQGSLPNLKRFLNRDIRRNITDYSLYMGALSYQFFDQGGVISSIEPKVIYRGVDHYKDIIDLGAQIRFWEDRLLVSGMYHSTNSVTMGVGTLYQNQLSILCLYTTGTTDLGKYSNGEFEIALRYQFR